MTQYQLKAADIEALTTALLSLTGNSDLPRDLIVPRRQPEFQPAGPFGELYERFKCYACHKFNGYGGTLAPDLSFEGSRAQRTWLIDFLETPRTLRPTLVLRMPQFNMTAAEATTIADYFTLVAQSPGVDVAEKGKQFDSQLAMK